MKEKGEELLKRLILAELRDEGKTVGEIATNLGICESVIEKVAEELVEEGLLGVATVKMYYLKPQMDKRRSNEGV